MISGYKQVMRKVWKLLYNLRFKALCVYMTAGTGDSDEKESGTCKQTGVM